MKIPFERLHEGATLPTRGTEFSAGLDIYATQCHTIWPECSAVIPTGLAVSIPEGCYGRIAPRSSLAIRFGLNVHAGVIDSDYRGEIKVCLINHGSKVYEVKPGDRIAQLILERCLIAEPEFMGVLEHTERGIGGFGSTGV